ncbi:hypothetical protein GF412_00680 [Candidatus Micrarchaeota archaeon]|nr:hypothetical protein [Candidatus Micrarchaeota archaeon]MBD3417488.1 hypothetical protein [Candidatus Micrarchaeota archaeon]
MRRLLFILCFVALLSAMSVELEQESQIFIEYKIEERGALDSSLTIVVFKDSTQYDVLQVSGFNGLHTGRIEALEPATYTFKAYNLDTGEDAEASITVSPQSMGMPNEQSVEQIKEDVAQEQASLEQVSMQFTWLPYLIVALLVVIAALIIFGNPLKKPKKKK